MISPSVPVSASVVDQVASALSASSLRHQAIASNIANRDTPGYQRLATSFDAAMGSARFVAEDASSATPSLEQDVVALSGNALRYESLSRALARYFSIVSAITNGARG